MSRLILLIWLALLLLLAGCGGLEAGTTEPAVGDTAVNPQNITLTWPPDAEAVDPEPVLQWETLSNAAQYRVLVVKEGTGETAVDQTVTDPLLPITLPLTKGTSYTWVVQAQNAANQVIAEAQSAFFVKDDLIVAWPLNGESVDARPILQWAGFSGATLYHVIVVDDDAFPPVVAFDQTTAETQIEVTPGLEPGSFSWTVQGLNEGGAILAELNSQFLVKAIIEVVEPANFAPASALSTLTWKAFPNAVVYQVILLDDDAYPPVVVADEETAATTWTAAEPLEPGSYSWTVWAKDANGVTMAEAVSQFIVEE